jgi:hypothetical protein
MRAAGTGPAEVAITCPNRFKQDDLIYRWIGSALLGTESVVDLGEIGFLDRALSGAAGAGSGGDEVGRIDNILVVPNSTPLAWCAVETQAVYFSGRKMQPEFQAVADARGKPVFPGAVRRPDFRSSGPKRLMPQLQIKVPTLRRWGKKTAVVVDKPFFDSLGPMQFEPDPSNADIAWFVVAASTRNGQACLDLADTRYTTLDHAVAGLTAGKPVTQAVFEARIRQRLAAHDPA